jgi:hypothetical protein
MPAEMEPQQMAEHYLSRVLLTCLCLASVSCAKAPPAAPPPATLPQEDPVVQQTEQTLSNLKRLAIAAHNFRDVHERFPPAVLMGPDGQIPHSWRIELLPFVDQEALYKQYRMNEPWDSENNKKVLEKMPAVFRSPFDDPKSTNSGYYALVGPGTMFEGTAGIRMAQVTDGSSNTLLIVEAKRSIPWTKPDDIAFDPEKPLPEVGGFIKGRFAGAMADGSVGEFDIEQVKDQLKWLIMRNDNHATDIEKLRLNPAHVPVSPRAPGTR